MGISNVYHATTSKDGAGPAAVAFAVGRSFGYDVYFARAVTYSASHYNSNNQIQ